MSVNSQVQFVHEAGQICKVYTAELSQFTCSTDHVVPMWLQECAVSDNTSISRVIGMQALLTRQSGAVTATSGQNDQKVF
jgi:hypothetical protein